MKNKKRTYLVIAVSAMVLFFTFQPVEFGTGEGFDIDRPDELHSSEKQESLLKSRVDDFGYDIIRYVLKKQLDNLSALIQESAYSTRILKIYVR